MKGCIFHNFHNYHIFQMELITIHIVIIMKMYGAFNY